MNLNKTLVIVRHAHREKPTGREADNGLSTKGRKQAKAIAKFYQEIFEKTKPLVYSSPKLRCIETIEPLAKKTKAKLEILDSLNEAITTTELLRKIEDFNAHLRSLSAPLVVICSHGDWIPAYLKQVFGIDLDLDKGGWIQIDFFNGKPQLSWVIQKLVPPFA